MDEGFGNLAPSLLVYPLHGRTGYAHASGALLLRKTFKIDQADGFKLLEKHVNRPFPRPGTLS